MSAHEHSLDPDESHMNTLLFYAEQMRNNPAFKIEMDLRMSVAWNSLSHEDRVMWGVVDELFYPGDPASKKKSARTRLLHDIIKQDIASYDALRTEFGTPDTTVG